MKTLFLVLLSCIASYAQTSTIKASWDVSAETIVIGYRVLSGPSPRFYTTTNVVIGRLNNTMTLSLAPGVTYITVMAFASDASLDSGFSNEVVWTNKVTSPTNFKVLRTISLD